MSMPNFNTMRNFPLYVRDFVSEVDYCPACNTYGEDGVCPQPRSGKYIWMR